jgi:hypothetical protein
MSELRDAMSIAETARLIQMSRSRFHQLIGTVFPEPKRDANGRPYFDRDQQAMIVEIRRRNVGVNGQPILFRATGSRTSSTPRRPKASSKPKQDHRDVLLAVRELGLTQATIKDVDECVRSLVPDGQLPDHGDLIRRVFLSLNGRFSRNKQA